MKYIKWSSAAAVLWILCEANAVTRGNAYYDKQPRIYKGSPVEITEVPFMGVLSYTGGPICGLFLIDRHNALTAHHCLNRVVDSVDVKKATKLLTVTVIAKNKHYPFRYTQKDLDVERVIAHPKYHGSTNGHQNDIAIIKIKPDLDWDDWDFQHIKLPDRAKGPLSVCEGSAYGWGIQSTSLDSNRNYRRLSSIKDISYVDEVTVPIIDNNVCQRTLQNTFSYAHDVSKDQLCAGAPGRGDTCKGDSGGPLIMKDSRNEPVAVGIVSYGYGCGNGLPSIYTNIAKYIKWIRRNLK